MSESLGALTAELTADTTGLRASLKKSEGLIKDYGRTTQTSLKKGDKAWRSYSVVARKHMNEVGKAAGLMAVAMTAALGAGGLKLISLASDLEETQGKFNVVFRGMTDVAEGWSRELVNSYAMAETESKKYLSSIQDMLVPTGMARDAAGELANKFVQMAADLGSFNNRETAQVMADIQSGLQGSSEVMAKYGINTKAAKIEQEIFNLGLAKTKDEITDAMKAEALYSIVMREGADAAGDMERTSGSYANQLKKAKANVKDLATALGKELLPHATKVVSAFNDWVKVNDEVIRQKIPELFSDAAGAAIFIIDAIDGVKRVFQIVGNVGALAMLYISKAAMNMADTLIGAPIDAINKLIETYNKIPGIKKVDAAGWDFGLGKAIDDEISMLSNTIEIAKKDILDLAETDLAGTALLKSMERATILAKQLSKKEKAADDEEDKASKTTEVKKKALEDFAKFYDGIMLSTYELDKKALDENFAKFKEVLGDKKELQIAYNTELAKLQKERDEGVVSKVDTSLEDYFSGLDAKASAERKLYDERKGIQDEFSAEQRALFMTDTEQEIYNLNERRAYYDKYVQDKIALEKWFAESLKQINENSVDANLSLSESVSKGIDMALKDIQEKTLTTAEMISSSIGMAVNGVTNAMGDWLSGTKSFKEAFKDMAQQVLKDLANMIMKQLIYNAISSIAGMGAKDGAAFDGGGAVLANAKGNAFTNSIVSQPTMFKYGNGKNLGVMGEAGPEAIMPLSRGAGGKLGVSAIGGQTQTVVPPPEVKVNNINVYDASIVGDYLSTGAGEQEIINIMQRNRSVMED